MSAKVEGSAREQGKLRIRMKAGMRTRDSELGSQVFERIEDLQAGSVKVFVVAGDDREVVPTGRSRNIAVFNRHSPARPFQLPLLFGPNVCDRNVEAENPSMQRSHKASEPGLQPAFGVPRCCAPSRQVAQEPLHWCSSCPVQSRAKPSRDGPWRFAG